MRSTLRTEQSAQTRAQMQSARRVSVELVQVPRPRRDAPPWERCCPAACVQAHRASWREAALAEWPPYAPRSSSRLAPRVETGHGPASLDSCPPRRRARPSSALARADNCRKPWPRDPTSGGTLQGSRRARHQGRERPRRFQRQFAQFGIRRAGTGSVGGTCGTSLSTGGVVGAEAGTDSGGGGATAVGGDSVAAGLVCVSAPASVGLVVSSVDRSTSGTHCSNKPLVSQRSIAPQSP